MRTLRVLVVGALIAGGLVVLAPGATASVSAASKTCKSLTALNQKLLQERMGDENIEVLTDRSLDERIRGGLRATLESESLVTGVLYIGLNFHPGAPPVFHQLKKRYPELPTKPTQIQQLMSNLASLDIKTIEKNLNALLA